MSEGINFESQRKLEEIRQGKRDVREKILKKAQKDFNNEKELKKKQLMSILPDIHKRVEQESKEFESVKHKKEKKQKYKKSDKSEKHKKHKKPKKHKKKSSDTESEEEWVEKTAEPADILPIIPKQEEKIERQSWMVTDDFENIFSQSKKNTSKEDMKKKEEEEDKLKQQTRELNPYWKDGGTGLPSDQSDTTKVQKSTTGHVNSTSTDGGLSWWTKALERCHQMAEQDGLSVQDVAAERYGSLESLMDKIKEAEKFMASSRGGMGRRQGSHAFKRPGERDYDDRRGSRRDYTFKRPSEKDEPGSKDGCGKDRSGVNNMTLNERKGGRYCGRREDRSYGGRNGWRKDGLERKSDDDKKKNDNIKREDVERRNENDCDKKKDLKRSDIRIEASSSSSSSSSDDEESTQPSDILNSTETDRVEVVLTSEEKNKLAAKILKAEIMGNTALVKELKAQMDVSNRVVAKEEGNIDRKVMKQSNVSGEMLMVVDRKGMTRPFEDGTSAQESGRRRKAVDTHEEGKRVRYFADDDKHSLESLIKNEKQTTSQHDQIAFARLSGKQSKNNVEDETVDDEWLQKESAKPSYIDSRSKQTAMIEQRRLGRKLDSCVLCFDNCLKHLVISIGRKVYLSLPSHRSIVEGHCIIAPLLHVTQSTVCDEDVLEEITTYKRQLILMFKEREEDVLFLETCKNLKSQPHFSIECIPMKMELAELAPIYFSKAINDSGGEWASNKKLVKVKGGSVKESVPAGFPYFHVSFALQSGFVHVIEDEASFPTCFGREVVGGMMELSPELWRRPHKDQFEIQCAKALSFSKAWKSFDHTLG